MRTSTGHDLHLHDDTLDGLLASAAVDPREAIAEAAAARSRRRQHRAVAILGAFACFLAIAAVAATVGFSGTGAPAAGTAPKVAVKAEALGVLVVRPGREAERVAASSPVAGATEHAQGASPSWSIDGVATVEQATTTARVAVRGRRSTATVTTARIELLGGRIQLTDASFTATAETRKGRAGGSLELDPSTKLVVDGVERPVRLNERIVIEGVGTVIVNEQAVLASAPSGDRQTGPRHRVVGAIAHLRVTQPTGGLAAGSEVVIGRVDAGIREGKVREVAHPSAGATPQASSPGAGTVEVPRRPSTVRGSASAAATANLQGYLFPVLGRHAYTNDWGAPRASTGIPHQGNDIFADEGTPIVAVTDGVLDRVGWNSIGGYRFWLFDQYGNSFYHAHLSAFSPLARDGARVRRGDVIGFVGHTGDAQYTPPHLHFEVHPGNAGPTNPYPFLGAWKRGVAVAIGLLTRDGDRVAPLSLLGFTDISANSGLQSSVLDSVPDTRARSIEQETAPRPTDESLKGAIEGPGISAR